jgi:hypothetical protein
LFLQIFSRASVVSSSWDKAVSTHPDKALLWRQYIEYHMANFSKFNVSTLRAVLERALSVLNGQKKRYNLGHEKHRFFEYRALVIAVTAAYLERQAGYSERGIAIFQALLEANLNCPIELQVGASRETFLDFLQAYWESQSPRFGEAGTKGWAIWQKMVSLHTSLPHLTTCSCINHLSIIPHPLTPHPSSPHPSPLTPHPSPLSIHESQC